VVATNDNGCLATDSITVFADPNALITAPNAFAPEGSNPYFHINLRGEAHLNHFRIYNRWGNQC